MESKITLNSKGLIELLKSREIQAAIDLAAQVVANKAGRQFEVVPSMHAKRYTATVKDPSDGSMFREAETGTLQRAVGEAGLSYIERKKGRKSRR